MTLASNAVASPFKRRFTAADTQRARKRPQGKAIANLKSVISKATVNPSSQKQVCIRRFRSTFETAVSRSKFEICRLRSKFEICNFRFNLSFLCASSVRSVPAVAKVSITFQLANRPIGKLQRRKLRITATGVSSHVLRVRAGRLLPVATRVRVSSGSRSWSARTTSLCNVPRSSDPCAGGCRQRP